MHFFTVGLFEEINLYTEHAVVPRDMSSAVIISLRHVAMKTAEQESVKQCVVVGQLAGQITRAEEAVKHQRQLLSHLSDAQHCTRGSGLF